MIKFTNEGDVISAEELTGRGIRKICTNLAGEHTYIVTAKAEEKLIKTHDCVYENGNDQLIKM